MLGHAVEIRADAHVIDAGNFHDVIEVIDQDRNGVGGSGLAAMQLVRLFLQLLRVVFVLLLERIRLRLETRIALLGSLRQPS